MADSDLIPARGIRGYAAVADTGIAVGGTLTVLQLAQRGMRSICAVDSNGLSSGGLTMLQLRARGIMGCCPVLETGLSADASTPYLTLVQRGLNPMCPVTALGVAQGGTATMTQLAQKGIQGFCPLTEAGAETTFGVAAFAGIGDVVSGAIAYWSSGRAYSNATKGGNLIRVRRNSDNAEQDFVSLSTGALDSASLTTFLAATTGADVTWYNQISSNHITQATAGQQPVVNLSGLGSFVTADFTAASTHALVSGSAISQTQPYTLVIVARTLLAAQNETFAETVNTVLHGYHSAAANETYIFAGGLVTATASDAAFHAITPVINGASSNIYVDGTSNAVAPGGANLGAAITIGGRVTFPFQGRIIEVAIYPVGFTGTQASNISSNIHSFYGF